MRAWFSLRYHPLRGSSTATRTSLPTENSLRELTLVAPHTGVKLRQHPSQHNLLTNGETGTVKRSGDKAFQSG